MRIKREQLKGNTPVDAAFDASSCINLMKEEYELQWRIAVNNQGECTNWQGQ